MQLQHRKRRNNGCNTKALLIMSRGEKVTYRCKRCNKAAGPDMICQSCKNELLTNYEVVCDWQTAFEIERATQTALRFRMDNEDDNSLFF